MPIANQQLSKAEKGLFQAAIKGLQSLYSSGESMYSKYAPDVVKEGVKYFNSNPDPWPGAYDNIIKGAFALPTLVSNPRYLKMLEKYAGSAKKLVNPIIERSVKQYGQAASKMDPEVWLHGSPQSIDKFERLGYNLDANTALGPHFGSTWDQARAFMAGDNPTLHVVKLKSENPALFPDEGRLRSIIEDLYSNHKRGAYPNPESMNEAGLDLMEKLLDRGHDSIVYGNMHEGYKGTPSAISFFPSKQVEIVGKTGTSPYGNFTNQQFNWLQDRMVEEKLMETVVRKQLQGIYGLTAPQKDWWK